MCAADPEVLSARYRPNKSCPLQTAPSQMIFILKKEEWIPDINGNFCKPSEINQDQLLDDFVYDDQNGWLSSISFGKNSHMESDIYQNKIEAAEFLGIKNQETIELIKKIEEDPELYAEIESLITSKR